MEKLRFGIVGAGSIAGTMAKTLSSLKEVSAYAVAARDLSRAKALAEQYGFPVAYGSYEELFCDDKVDVVYIGTPNSHHFPHAKEALLHGKHVICEKAFTLNEAQAAELFALAKERGLFIMEAIWTRFFPAITKIRELLHSGAIGEPRSLTVSFGVNRPDMERLHKASLGGGALLDVGLYVITFADLVFGGEITNIDSAATLNEDGADTQNAMIFRYRGGKMAVLHSSVSAELSNSAVVSGTRGRMVIDHFWCPSGFLVYQDGSESPQAYDFPFEINGYEYEILAAVKDIEAGRVESGVMPHAKTLSMMRLYDGLRQTWGIVFPQEK